MSFFFFLGTNNIRKDKVRLIDYFLRYSKISKAVLNYIMLNMLKILSDIVDIQRKKYKNMTLKG